MSLVTVHYRYLENTQGGSNKFYEVVTLHPKAIVSYRWGKIGSVGRMGPPVYDFWEADSKVEDKLNGGYDTVIDEVYGSVQQHHEQRLLGAMMATKPAQLDEVIGEIIAHDRREQKSSTQGSAPTMTILDEAGEPGLAERINALIPTAVGNPDDCFAAFGAVKEEIQQMRRTLQAAEDQYALLEAIMTERLTA